MIQALDSIPSDKRTFNNKQIEGQRQRRQTERQLEIPAKPDPDVLAIMRNLDLRYGRAKMLKALSFGIPVEHPLLLWCLDQPKGNCHTIYRHLDEVKRRHPWLKIRHCSYRIQVVDEVALGVIRNAMRQGT